MASPLDQAVDGILAACAAGHSVHAEPGLIASLLARAGSGPDAAAGCCAHQLGAGQAVRLLVHAAGAAGQLEVSGSCCCCGRSNRRQRCGASAEWLPLLPVCLLHHHHQCALLEVQSATALYPRVVPQLLHALSGPQRRHLADSLQQQAAMRQQQQQQHGWAQRLALLGEWDVLLLLGLWSQQQWEEGAGVVLLQGAQDMPR